MSTNKTTNYGLHSWVGGDFVRRLELNENFTKIDTELKRIDGEHDTKLSDIDSKILAIETKNSDQDTRLTDIETLNTQQDARMTDIELVDSDHGQRLTLVENNKADKITPYANLNHVRVVRQSNLAIPANTQTTVSFTLEDFDGKSQYDLTTSVFTPKEDGVYLLDAHVNTDLLDGNWAILYFQMDRGAGYYNDTTVNRNTVKDSANMSPMIDGTTAIAMKAGEKFRLAIQTDVACNILNFGTTLKITKIC